MNNVNLIIKIDSSFLNKTENELCCKNSLLSNLNYRLNYIYLNFGLLAYETAHK